MTAKGAHDDTGRPKTPAGVLVSAIIIIVNGGAAALIGLLMLTGVAVYGDKASDGGAGVTALGLIFIGVGSAVALLGYGLIRGSSSRSSSSYRSSAPCRP